MGKAFRYYRFQYPLIHIDVKIFKYIFPAHFNSNSVVLHLNIKIIKSTGMVPTLDMYIQG